MSVKDTIAHIIDQWFLYEPLLFNVYCTHRLVENKEMKIPFRTGRRRIEYNPDFLEEYSEEDMELALKTEVTRILLKHPYQRVPENPNGAALKIASDITINNGHCFYNNKIHDAWYYKFSQNLSFEEYYKELYFICPNFGDGQDYIKPAMGENEVWEYEAAAEASELWSEDEEIADSINQQIEKAQRTNQWGSISGCLQESVIASLKIPMDYRRILSQFRASIISQRRKLTRMKPNRRYGFDYMGSRIEPKTHLLVGVDVSGSISSDDLQNFFSIINRFFCYGVKMIHVVAFDAQIKQEFDLKKAKTQISIIGRGGTDFQCVVDYYEEHPEYQGMILFTDGYAPSPQIKKVKKIMWILTGKMEYDSAIQWIKDLPDNKATWIPLVKKTNF